MSRENDVSTVKRPRRFKRILLVAGLGLVCAALLGGIIILWQPAVTTADAPVPLDVERTQVLRGDLIETIRVQGTLGHGASRDVGTSLEGIITAIPTSGTIVGVGDELFRIDDLPVIMMQGELPAWRTFSEDMSNGNDVLQLERSLAKLGYFRLTPDTKFTAATKTAVKYWQKSLGFKQTGTIEHGRIVFSTNEVRIQDAKPKVGAAASGEIVSITGVKKQVQVFLETAQQSLAKKKTKVEVALPGGITEKGSVVSVGTPVEKEGENGNTRKIPVTVELEDEKATENLHDVPVGVQFTSVKAKDVIQVPVSALLAQPGGGFAVEVTEGQNVRLVPVNTGVFANGLVEVVEGDLQAADSVVVAK